MTPTMTRLSSLSGGSQAVRARQAAFRAGPFPSWASGQRRVTTWTRELRCASRPTTVAVVSVDPSSMHQMWAAGNFLNRSATVASTTRSSLRQGMKKCQSSCDGSPGALRLWRSREITINRT